MDSIKGAVKSLTIWFNSVMASLVVAIPLFADMLPQLEQHLPADTYRYLALFLIVGNMLLRFRTTKALSEK